jgi:Sugar kinases, ribokinase family
MGIVVFGAVLVDIKGFPFGKFVTRGRNAGRVTSVHGGVSRNVVEDIANVELRPTFVSVLDHSATSQEIIEKLNRHKVNTKYIRKTDDGLGKWLAVFNNEGDVVASISQRPNLEKIADTLTKYGDEIISHADSVVVEIDMDSDLLNQIFALCEKYHKKIFAVVSNMSIAMERRDLMTRTSCIVCNANEAGLLFSEDYSQVKPMTLARLISEKIKQAKYPKMVVTMGEQGAVYAEMEGSFGVSPAQNVEVVDAAGCGDAFFAGVTIGLTYGKTLPESCEIGTRLASSVITTTESVCPRFRPEEFNLVLPEELAECISKTES